MPIIEETLYVPKVVQRHDRKRGAPLQLQLKEEEDKLLIIFKLYTMRVRRRGSRSRYHVRGKRLIEEKDMWVSLSHFKHQLSEYEHHISDCLSSLGVPEHAQPRIIQAILPVVEAVETTRVPVIVYVLESHCRFGRRSRQRRLREFGQGFGRPKFTPAAIWVIEGLKPVQVDDCITGQMPTSCAICLEDFDRQKAMTMLPCEHHFHVHCIVQCLKISHLCPLCRYAMPTIQDYVFSF